MILIGINFKSLPYIQFFDLFRCMLIIQYLMKAIKDLAKQKSLLTLTTAIERYQTQQKISHFCSIGLLKTGIFEKKQILIILQMPINQEPSINFMNKINSSNFPFKHQITIQSCYKKFKITQIQDIQFKGLLDPDESLHLILKKSHNFGPQKEQVRIKFQTKDLAQSWSCLLVSSLEQHEAKKKRKQIDFDKEKLEINSYYQSQIKKIQSQMKNCITDNQKGVKLFQKKVQSLQGQNGKLSTQKMHLKQQILKLNSLLESQRNQIANNRKSYDTKMKQSQQKYLQIIKQKQQIINQLKLSKQSDSKSKEQNIKLVNQRQKLSKKIQQLQQKLGQAGQKYRQLVQFQSKKDDQYYHIFEGDVLSDHLDYKKFIRNSIQKYRKRQILRTKIIYAFDQRIKQNFHSYIDKQRDIVLILRTQNGHCLAAYSIASFDQKAVATEGGLLISVTNKRIFKNIPGKNSVTYDQYYLMFGNSQIRIKSNEMKVFSNIGIANCYYEANGQSPNILLGENEIRQVELKGYQIHKIYFRE